MLFERFQNLKRQKAKLRAPARHPPRSVETSLAYVPHRSCILEFKLRGSAVVPRFAYHASWATPVGLPPSRIKVLTYHTVGWMYTVLNATFPHAHIPSKSYHHTFLSLCGTLRGGAPQRAGKRPASSSGTGSAKKKLKAAAAAAPIPLRVDEEDSPTAL